MIKPTVGFLTSSGKVLPLQEAQVDELLYMCQLTSDATEIMQWIVHNKDKVIDVLTTKETSLPQCRAVNGGKKPRKPRAVTPEPATTTAA